VIVLLSVFFIVLNLVCNEVKMYIVLLVVYGIVRI